MIKIFNNSGVFLIILTWTSSFISLYAFDYKFYSNKYKDVPKHPISAFHHYLDYGFYHGRECAPRIENTNFDWQYYIEFNNLNINNAKDAKIHYDNIGKKQSLEFCKKFKIAIILHLYNINLIDEFIKKINHFVKINNNNDFYIKINIPISNNIDQYKSIIDCSRFKDKKYFHYILRLTPYHKYLVTPENYPILTFFDHKLKHNLKIPPKNIQIIFSENRGADIGGFLLSIDQMFKENLPIDYIVKVHSKTDNSWRQLLTSILNLRVNKILRKYDYIYNCHINTGLHPDLIKLMNNDILKKFNMPYKKNFGHASGTMFIASIKLIEFFKDQNLLNLFNTLNTGDYFHNPIAPPGFKIEHEYEAFFGYLASYLNLKHKIIGYIKDE